MRLALIGAHTDGGLGAWARQVRETLVTEFPSTSVDVLHRGNWELAKHPDGVIIASPAEAHAAQALYYVARGIPVFVEKPLALSIRDAERVGIAVEAQRGLPFLVDHVHLFSPAYRKLKEVLLDPARTHGAVEDLAAVCNGPSPERACGTLWDWGPHALAYVVDLMPGAQVTRALRLPGQYHVTLQGAMVGATLTFGVAEAKTHRLSVFTRRGDWLAQDNRHQMPLTYNGFPVPVLDARRPLTVALDAWLGAIEGLAGSGPGLGVNLGISVVRLLAEIARQLPSDAPGPEAT